MAKTKPNIYLDSCLFVHYVEKSPEGALVKDLFDDVKLGNISLVTSVTSVCETLYAKWERANNKLDPKVEAAINTLWHPNTGIQLVETSYAIAARAKDIFRLGIEKGWAKLKARDCTHLATAELVQPVVTEVFSYEVNWPRYKSIIGIEISRPHRNWARNTDTGPLFTPPPSQ